MDEGKSRGVRIGCNTQDLWELLCGIGTPSHLSQHSEVPATSQHIGGRDHLPMGSEGAVPSSVVQVISNSEYQSYSIS